MNYYKISLYFRISNPKDDKTKVNVSISLKFYKELQSHGADDVLKREYGDLLVTPEEGGGEAFTPIDHDISVFTAGFDVTVQLDLGSVPDNWEELVKKCGLLKRNCFAAVFEKYFQFQVTSLIKCRDWFFNGYFELFSGIKC